MLAALCRGVIVGRSGRACGDCNSSRSSGGVKKGSSGGCCSTTGREERDEYDLNEGVGAFGATHSVDKPGSIAIVGTSDRDDVSNRDDEFCLERLMNTAASADRCRVRKWLADSEDRLPVVGRDGPGFITCNLLGPIESRKLSPCANGRGQLSKLTRMGPMPRSGVLLRVTGISGDLLEVSWLQCLAVAGRTPFSLETSKASGSSSRDRLRRRTKKHIKRPMITSPAIAPERPPMIACLCFELLVDAD